MDLHNLQWKGYLRQNGVKGIRNKLLIIYTVKCSSFIAKKIAEKLHCKDIDVVGFDGCYDNEYAVRLLLSLIRHPNVGAVLAVGLGCEYIQPAQLAQKAKATGRLSEWFYIQQHGGTAQSIDYGVSCAQKLLLGLQNTPVVMMNFGDLTVGAECGGSDYTSGLAGNILVGRFFDMLQEIGGTAIFEEIVEAVGLKKHLVERAANKEIGKKISNIYDKAMNYCKSVKQYSISPGNFTGGISSIEEKSMGAIVKSGSKPIVGVLKVSEIPSQKGLWLLDSTPDPYWMQFGYTNPNDNEGLIDLISCGCQFVFLVTGRGNVVGSAVAPVFKITGNSDTYKRMPDDMDFDASAVLNGKISEVSESLFKEIYLVCSGKNTKAEELGHKECFIPYKYQAVDLAAKKCKFNGLP